MNQARKSALKEKPILRYREDYVRDRLFYHYCQRVLRTSPDLKDQERIYRVVGAVAKWLTSEGINKNLNIYGNVGIGKSTILGSLMDFLNEGEYMYSKVLITANNMADIALNSESSWERITTVPILLLDDVGTEPYEVKEFGNVYLPFTELIECRYNRRLTTVITTNLSIDDVNNRYGARIADRICEFHTIEYKRKSYRNE